jgi:hypothetical protein
MNMMQSLSAVQQHVADDAALTDTKCCHKPLSTGSLAAATTSGN